MDRLDIIEAERACERLVTRYALAVNDWDIDAFVSLFAPDAVWQRPGVQPLNGHGEIRGFMKSQPTKRILRHVNGLCLVDVIDADNARCISQTTVYDTHGPATIPAPQGAPDMVVEYRDKLVRRDGEWYFAERNTTVVFSAAVKA